MDYLEKYYDSFIEKYIDKNIFSLYAEIMDFVYNPENEQFLVIFEKYSENNEICENMFSCIIKQKEKIYTSLKKKINIININSIFLDNINYCKIKNNRIMTYLPSSLLYFENYRSKININNLPNSIKIFTSYKICKINKIPIKTIFIELKPGNFKFNDKYKKNNIDPRFNNFLNKNEISFTIYNNYNNFKQKYLNLKDYIKSININKEKIINLYCYKYKKKIITILEEENN